LIKNTLLIKNFNQTMDSRLSILLCLFANSVFSSPMQQEMAQEMVQRNGLKHASTASTAALVAPKPAAPAVPASLAQVSTAETSSVTSAPLTEASADYISCNWFNIHCKVFNGCPWYVVPCFTLNDLLTLHPFYIGGQLIVLIWNRQLIFGSHQLARI
jgi:hypothetical protein